MATAQAPEQIRLRNAVLYSVGLALLWIVLAFMRPEITYHLAPLLVAGLAPLAVAFTSDGDATRSGVAVAGATGLGLALTATALLSLTNRLEGPSLLSVGDATLEAVLFAVVGSVTGTAIGLMRAHVAASGSVGGS